MSCTTHFSGHSCVLLDSSSEQQEIVLSLLKEGLRDDEQCFLVAPDRLIGPWLSELRAHGVDVEAARGCGALKLGSAWERPGMHSLEMARRVWRDIEAGLREFPAIRYVVDMTVILESGMTAGHLCHWEATLNTLIEGEPVRVYCLYNLCETASEVVHSAVRTHPSVILQNRLLPNPHYEATRILDNEPWLNESRAGRGEVEDLLGSLANLY